MTPWWTYLRTLFIKNEFWHHPDSVLLALILKKYKEACKSSAALKILFDANNDEYRRAESCRKEWLDRAASLSLILPDGNPIPFTLVAGPSTIIQAETRRLASYALVPYGLRNVTIDVRYSPEYDEALKPAFKALTRMRSYYNSGRMADGLFGISGPPPLVSLQYKRIVRSANKYHDFASWSGSKSPKTDSQIQEHISNVASNPTTWRGTIPDPRATYSSDPDILSRILHLPRLCEAIITEQPYEETDHDPTDEVITVFTNLTRDSDV